MVSIRVVLAPFKPDKDRVHESHDGSSSRSSSISSCDDFVVVDFDVVKNEKAELSYFAVNASNSLEDDNSSVIIDTVKRAEDSNAIILRLYEVIIISFLCV